MRAFTSLSLGLLTWAITTLSVSSSALPSYDVHPQFVARAGSNDSTESSTSSSGWPYGPFKTSGREIQTSRGDNVTFIGTNWPLSGETMLPEGLEYSSLRSIIERMASLGFNFVRHGYAIQMIDELYPSTSADDEDAQAGNDVTIKDALIAGLGEKNGTSVLARILENQKEFKWTENTTRFEVLDTVARVEKENGLLMHLDNHVSKAKWCCSHTDGNAWFDDVYFDVKNWTRGLAHMAKWAKGHDNIVSMSLRNELRNSDNITTLDYGWVTWAGNFTLGLDAIYAANPDLLVTVSGMQYDEDVSALSSHLDLRTAYFFGRNDTTSAPSGDAIYFDPQQHPWGKNVILEMHLYGSTEDPAAAGCEGIQAGLYARGGNALGIDKPAGCANATEHRECVNAPHLYPVILSEFGHAQDASIYNDTLIPCLRDWTTKNKIGWAQWSLAGSYMIRQGVQDFDDTWALLNHNWSDFRNQQVIDGFWKPWVKDMGKTGLEL